MDSAGFLRLDQSTCGKRLKIQYIMILIHKHKIETFDQHEGWLKKRLCRWQSKRAGRQIVMPHIKTYTRITGDELEWFLLTSANLSRAAWGQYQKDHTQIYIKSYELGVLLCRELFQVSILREQARSWSNEHYNYNRIYLTTSICYLPRSKIAFLQLKNLCHQQPLFQSGFPMIYLFCHMDLRMNAIQGATHLERWRIILVQDQQIS